MPTPRTIRRKTTLFEFYNDPFGYYNPGTATPG